MQTHPPEMDDTRGKSKKQRQNASEPAQIHSALRRVVGVQEKATDQVTQSYPGKHTGKTAFITRLMIFAAHGITGYGKSHGFAPCLRKASLTLWECRSKQDVHLLQVISIAGM
jgi:hypothetical protein